MTTVSYPENGQGTLPRLGVPEAKSSVQEGGPPHKEAQPLSLFEPMSSQDLVNAARDARVAAAKAVADADAMEGEVLRRMLRDGARIVFHPDLEVFLDPVFSEEIRVDTLRQLYDLGKQGLCDPAVVKKAVFMHVPPPVWKTNLTYLNMLKKCGGVVAGVIEKGVVRTFQRDKLVIKEKKK